MQTIDRANVTFSLLRWHLPLMLAALSLVVMSLGDAGATQLRYERDAVLEGELWRLLTGHLAHLGWSHLLLNLAGLMLVWLLCGQHLTTFAWWLLLLACALGDSLCLFWFEPTLQWYVGLSGVLHGLLVAGCLAGWVRKVPESLPLLVAVSVKLGWEQWAGPLPGSEVSAGGRVVVDAHLYGAISGAIAMLVLLAVPAWRRRGLVSRRP